MFSTDLGPRPAFFIASTGMLSCVALHKREIIGATSLVHKWEVQASGEENVITFFSSWWIGHVNVGKRVLPTEPFVDLCNRSKIEFCLVFSRISQIRIEVCLLRKPRPVEFMHEFLT